jgi:hypothetical protein
VKSHREKPERDCSSAVRTAIFLTAAFCTGIQAGSQQVLDVPVGIPEPEFGIQESHNMYSQSKLLTSEPDSVAYNDAGNGPYSHYIDNTHPDATNTNNPYGTSEKPRLTLPKNEYLHAGSVIEVAGGPYDLSYTVFQAAGTKNAPVFLRGYSEETRVLFRGGKFYLSSEYTIVENIEFQGVGMGMRPVYEGNKVNYVALRNCKVHDRSTTLLINSSNWEDNPAQNIVYYRNHIYGGTFDTSTTAEIPEKDACGIYGGKNSQNVWILENDIHTFTGDAIGAGHGVNYTTRNYYIGRNRLHHCAENGIDLKEVENFIISQNEIYGFKGQSSGSDGTATVVHYGPRYSPKNVWFLFNSIHTCSDVGIQVGGDQVYDVYYIGNIIHNIHNAQKSADAYRTWSSRKVFLIGNLFFDVDNGIESKVNGKYGELVLLNNIISRVSTNGYHFRISGTEHMEASTISNNIFWQDGDGVKLEWGSTDMTLGQFISASRKGKNCYIKDPQLIDPENGVFSISPQSPAIDSGLSHDVYDLFREMYGISISYDYFGNPRPFNGQWDIGPVEYHNHTSIGKKLSPPRNLRIIEPSF